MRLAGFLDPDLVRVPLTAGTKPTAVRELLDAIIAKHPFLDASAIATAVAEREEVENTSMGRGFAFPHARSESVDRMYIALGISHAGIPDDTPDGEDLRVVVLLLTPRNIARLYLQTLSAFVSLCRTPELRKRLFEARTGEDALRTIWESGVMVQNELSARDIMRRPVISVRPGATLKEVANLMYKHRISGMPVVDEQNRIIGEISERELIAAAMPDYAQRAESGTSTTGAEPFEDLLKRENEITVLELMTPPVAVVDEDKGVIELAALMLHKNIRRVIVASGGELVGLIMRSDIVSRVIRG
jgi:PTS system nitrogen regulatory IIA component